MISCYREGTLVQAAIRSAATACDSVIVYEGPAGEPLPNEEECPGSDFTPFEQPVAWSNSILHHGRWRTDARKRQAMLEATRKYDAPVWGVWIDGDEILMNGEWLRDWLQNVLWRDDQENPTVGFPIPLMELDGSLTICRAKVVRLDLIAEYLVSSHYLKLVNGQRYPAGNEPLTLQNYLAPRREMMETKDRLYAWPPFPHEPYLVHRSAFRHPARRGLRLHEQEAKEMAALDGRP